MKKFVSIFLAACAMSAMSVTAFARQADAVNVMSDESLKLSFGEETFEQAHPAGSGYTYPLYLEQEGGKLVPLTDEHLEDLRLRAETKNGRSVLSSFEVEKEGDRYQLEVTAQAGWPTAQTEVEGTVKAVKRSNGKAVGSVQAEMTVGYPTIPDEALADVEDGGSVFVAADAPVITTKQFEQLDKAADGGKVTFTNGLWSYQVRVSGQESLNLLHNERAIKEVSSKFEDQNFKYISFPGGPAFDFTGTMTIDLSEEMEDFGGQFYVYRYLQGRLHQLDATVDLDAQTLSFQTKNLGRFVITDKAIADGTLVDESFAGTQQAPSENTNQNNQSSQSGSQNDGQNGSYSKIRTTRQAVRKGNPDTGAEDHLALAAAAAVVSALAASIISQKKIKLISRLPFDRKSIL